VSAQEWVQLWLALVVFGITAVFLIQFLLECCVRACVRGFFQERAEVNRRIYEKGVKDGE
jgi:hypothetical protein